MRLLKVKVALAIYAIGFFAFWIACIFVIFHFITKWW